MSTNSDFDRRAATFLAVGPTELSDRVLDAALGKVHQTPQRRGLTAPWRFLQMPAAFRLATAAVVAVLAVGGAAYVIGLRATNGPAAPASVTAVPSGSPAPAACGHELAQGLYLTPGCEYRTSNLPLTLTIVSDGSWMDQFQTANVLDLIASSGPARETTIRMRPLRTVLENPCEWGSSPRRSTTPGSAREYLDWLGGFSADATTAEQVDLLGVHGWRFDTAARLPAPTPSDLCPLLSLAEPPSDVTSGEAEALVIDPTMPVRVYVLDAGDSVLIVSFEIVEPVARDATEAFLAGMRNEP
jgi:hypothetical protein